ncbi:hypothetical protein [Bradyrhizobium lablabi]|nr:hypothetical protein [Bradyrhizobium lablabi]
MTLPLGSDFWYYTFMAKSNKVVPQNRRGRPATGRDPVTAIRLSIELRENVDAWAAKQPEAPSRSEAIRRLVELGLQVKMPARPVSNPGRKLRAQELATKAIEKMIDPAAPPEERAQRRSRLTKGPTEFREARVDLPKAKGK